MIGSRACKFVLFGLSLAYLVAMMLFLVGTFGFFGAETDPLSGIYLVLLGLPWNRFVDYFPESLWPWLAAACPVINIILVFALCRKRFAPGK